MLPYNLEKQMKNPTKLYSYGEVVELVAWALVNPLLRNESNIDKYKEQHPDIFDQKCIEADRLISYA